ncbi:MAG: carbon-nitrogen hydrolase family protein [Deltaproteobacteria bacterium]|nr:carbon-nitrogen hydrolase family protein [Deltaproteobacteria bacterium]
MKLGLVAVQLEVDAHAVASPEQYRGHLEAAAARAIASLGPAEARVVVFPELAGHLALLALAPPAAHKAKTLSAALGAAAVRRPLDVLRGAVTTRLLDPRHAVLAALAPDGERYWRGVFGPLARKHGVHVVAGSHLRLGPNGDLTNASFLFAPDGRLLATTDKVNLVPGMEDRAPKALGLARGEADRLPITETQFGRICTLICYDGFREPHTSEERFIPMGPRVAARGGVTVVANPSANPWPWREPWTYAEPGNAHEPASRELQWEREGLMGSLAQMPFARWGVTAHLVGRVLDLHFDGQSEIVERDARGVRRVARADHHDRGGHVTATVTC